ncbi:MAG: TonB-dependent receptor plug domain-containing protein [Myxococcota bacterium]
MFCSLLALTTAAIAQDAPPPAPDAPPPDPRPPPTTIGVTEPVFLPPALTAPMVPTWPPDVPIAPDQAPVGVDLELLVDEKGAVEEVKVVAGEEPFASAAVALAKGTTFQPATEDGAPVAVWVPVHLEYLPPAINVVGVIRIAGGGRLPAVGLPVTIAGQTALTDEEGRFAFRGIPPGQHRLQVLDEDLRVETQSVEVKEGEAVELDLWAKPTKLDLGIVGTYRRERDVTTRRTLTAEELRTTPGTMGDPLRAVSNLPGAVRTPLDAGWLLIRGGDPRDTGVYIDGVRVPLIYHLGGFTSVVHPGFVERVDFYPGGQYARYGRATAGAVDLVTRDRPEHVEVRAGLNVILAGAYAAVPIGKKAGITLGARRSYLDAVLNAVPGVTEEQAKVAPRFWDWQLRADAGPFSVFGLGYVDSINASTSEGQEAEVSLQTQRLHGAWRDDELLGKPLLVKPWIAFDQTELVIAVLDRQQLAQTLSGGGRLELADDGEGKVGWSLGADVQSDWYGIRLNHIDRYASVTSPDVYGDLRFGDSWRVVAGLRLDTLFVTDQIPRAAPSPRFSAEVPVNDFFVVHGDAGIYHQLPPLELLVAPPEGAALQMERAYAAGAGGSFRYGPWRLDLDAFNRFMDRMTAYEEDGSLGQGQGQAWGIESMFKYQRGRVSGWVTYSFTASLRRQEAFDDDHVDPDEDEWDYSPYDQPHTVVAVAAFDLGKNWTFASRWRYASGFPIECLKGDAPYCDKYVQGYDVFLQQNLQLDPGRTEPFHALDLKISRQAIYRRWHLDFYLDVQNVYNRRVAEPLISGIWEGYGTQTYGYGLPVLPIFGVEGVFGG